MSDFVLKTDGTPGVTSVSNLFLDYYMPGANGEYVKVYLYLLRALNRPDIALSVAGLADVMDNTESDILRALKYWEKQGILSLECDDPTSCRAFISAPSRSVAKKQRQTATVSPAREGSPDQNPTVRKSSSRSPSSQNAGSFSLCATSTLERLYLPRRLRPLSIFMTSFISPLI